MPIIPIGPTEAEEYDAKLQHAKAARSQSGRSTKEEQWYLDSVDRVKKGTLSKESANQTAAVIRTSSGTGLRF